MKAISLIQPYGQLIIDGRKRIETRSWRTNYRGELYIHCSKGINKYYKQKCIEFGYDISKLDFGKIIGKCELIDCFGIGNMVDIDEEEKQYGIYEDGRYGWLLKNITKIEPFAIKGHLMIWNF
jgi:hypothetical protein